jgi:hypothetical protein
MQPEKQLKDTISGSSVLWLLGVFFAPPNSSIGHVDVLGPFVRKSICECLTCIFVNVKCKKWYLKRVLDEIVLHTMYGGHLWHFQFRKWSWDVIFAPFETIAWMSYNEQNLFTNRQIVHVKFRNAFAKRHQLWPCFCVFS